MIRKSLPRVLAPILIAGTTIAMTGCELAGLLSMGGGVPPSDEVEVTQADNHGKVHVEKGEQCYVCLYENLWTPTGSTWFIAESDESRLTLANEYTWVDPAVSGERNQQHAFVFKAIETGTVNLRFEYKRSLHAAVEESFDVTIIIE